MILFILLALDVAGFAHGDIGPNAAAVIALVLAIIALAFVLAPDLRGRVP